MKEFDRIFSNEAHRIFSIFNDTQLKGSQFLELHQSFKRLKDFFYEEIEKVKKEKQNND